MKCKIKGCKNKHYAKGKCKKHYDKAYQKMDKWKAYHKTYQKTDKYKVYNKTYQRAYRETDKYKAKRWKPPKSRMQDIYRMSNSQKDREMRKFVRMYEAVEK